MTELTQEQKKAIEYDLSEPACVSASAGSGKTFVLVEHIAKLISDEKKPVPADRLAAVTFTEKAAAELKQRLSQRVESLMENAPHNEFLREQLVRLSSARISTISSFCLSLVRDNIRLLPEIDEGFKICDPTRANILSEKAEEKTFEHIYTCYSEEKKKTLFKKLGKKEDIIFSVKKLHSFLSDIPDPDGWKTEQESVFGDAEKYFDKYVREFTEEVPKDLKTLSELCRSAAEELPSDRSASSENFRSFFGFIAQRSETAQAALERSDFKESYLAVKEAYPGTSPAARSKALKEGGFKEKKEEIVSLYEKCALGLSAAANYKSDAAETEIAFGLLREVTELYEKEYEKIKRAEGVLDFSDLEKNALKAVRQGGGKGMFDCIIVDEFQDSNDIQYEIFRTLSGGDKNLYFVGDVKQCIYAYRSANPKIFAGLIKNPAYNSLELNTNFRSSENVIDAVNAVFGGAELPHAFSEGCPWEDMKAGRGIKSEDKNIAEFITINVLRGGKSENDQCREEKYVAKRIIQMVNEGFTVHERGKEERKCGFGDFAVLLRTNRDCVEFRKVFEEYGIPCVSEGERHFTDLTETEPALAIFSAALRPNNDAETVKALMSPIYGFTAEDVANLRLAGKAPSSLYSNITKLICSNDKKTAEKAAKFDADMKLLRKTASNSVTYDLIQKIYEITMLPLIMRAGYSGREREENLKLLLHYAKGNPVPAEFLTFMKKISRSKLEMEQATVKEREENSVKLMTVHKSKGLQFPVVFVSGINKKPNKTDAYKDFIFDSEKGLGALVCDYETGIRAETASHRALEKDYADRSSGEGLRLFYVALTRAEEKLIITAENKPKANKGKGENRVDESSNVFASSESYFAFMTDRLPQTKEKIKTVRIPTDEDVSPAGAAEQAPRKAVLPDAERLRKNLLYKYPYEKATVTPAKFTATALGVSPESGGTGGEDNITSAFYTGTPLFMKEGAPISGKELGDIYHCVMEHIDFSVSDAESELRRLLKENIITEKEKNAVSAEEIQSFMDSSLCRRAAASGKITREFKLFTTVNGTGAPFPDNEDLSFIQGIADMFFEEDDGIVLIDYKTNKGISLRELKEKYAGQLSIYKKALEEMLGKRVKECWLYGFSLAAEIML